MASMLTSGTLRATSTFQQQQGIHLQQCSMFNGKAHFQQRYGLAADPGVPLVGMVGRLAAQKGTDVVLAALPALLECSALDTVDWQRGKGTTCTDCSLPYQGTPKPHQIALLSSGWSPAMVSATASFTLPGAASAAFCSCFIP